MIPASVLVMTRMEGARIERCLRALQDFDEVIVVDSHSTDDTLARAAACGARIEHFAWNGAYPKKRQFCLDHISIKHDWVFFCDADEVVTPVLVREMARFDPAMDGYFITGKYVMDGRVLQFGACNRKLCFFNRHRFVFPVIDDLACPGMGEMEGHYQPVPRPGMRLRIGRMRENLLHYAYDERAAWVARHERYAAWERCMNAKKLWPKDPVWYREWLKMIFRAAPFRPQIAFLHSYLFKGGFLDGRAGWRLARDRASYYKMIARVLEK